MPRLDDPLVPNAGALTGAESIPIGNGTAAALVTTPADLKTYVNADLAETVATAVASALLEQDPGGSGVITANIIQSETEPVGQAIGDYWDDISGVVTNPPTIAAIYPQAWLNTLEHRIQVAITDPKNVNTVTLSVTSSDSEVLPVSAEYAHFEGAGNIRELVIQPLPNIGTSVLSITALNSDARTATVSFPALTGATNVSVAASVIGANGTISPAGVTTLVQGGSINYTFTPAEGHQIKEILVNGVPIFGVDTYTFNNLINDSTISVEFESQLTVPLFETGESDGLTVPVIISDAPFYLITETEVQPLAAAAGWSAVKPTEYTTATGGTKPLYPWAKDADGNVSVVFATPRIVTFIDAYLFVKGTGADESQVFVDSSPTPKTVTTGGGAKIVGNALVSDGAGDYLSIPHDAALNFGPDRTLSLWFKPAALTGRPFQSMLLSKGPLGSLLGWYLMFDNTTAGQNITFSADNNGGGISVPIPASVTVNNWSHCELTVVSGITYLRINGVLVGSTDLAWGNTAGPLIVGSWNYNVNNYSFYGSLDEVLIANGALHTADFEPAARPTT